MPGPSIDPGDLLDLKLMPAWVKESSGREDYANYEGEVELDRPERPRPGPRQRERRRREQRAPGKPGKRRDDDRKPPGGKRRDFHRRQEQPGPPEQPLEVTVQFFPRPAVLDNVVAQVKAEALAYSLFFLARSFLEKPQRYEVGLKAKPESPLYRLGEGGALSSNSNFVESNAFRLARDQFYRVEVTQTEPLKGNFTSVARCRLSGTSLGPTNHHDYQRKLRALYEQRFSRRMSFPEYQRQIEIVTDPATVEQWKEEARNVKSFVSLREPPVTFQTEAEAERDFRQNHFPGLIQLVEEMVVDGVSSRQLADRRIRGHVEQAWAAENRSPSHMMQELAKRFRDAGLHIFRHRRGMLFVSSIRVRPFAHDDQGVSPQVKAILDLVTASPRVRRKEVADKLLADAGEDLEARRLALASDLRWLISEGYLIEFNDGALDLPRSKAPTAATPSAGSSSSGESPVDPSEAPSSKPQSPENTQAPISNTEPVPSSGTSPDRAKTTDTVEDDVNELGFA